MDTHDNADDASSPSTTGGHSPNNDAHPGPSNSESQATLVEQTKQNYISERNVPTFRMLRKVIKQATKAAYHFENLQKNIDNNRTPKGFGVKRIEFKVPEVSLVHQIRWEKAHTNLSLELTKIARDHWKDRKDTLKSNFEVLKSQIHPDTSSEELQYIDSLIDKYEEEATNELFQKTEKKKLQAKKTVEKQAEETTT